MQVLVLGAGQLARMMALDCAPLGIEIRAYDVRSHRVVHPVTWHDYGDDLDAGISKADVITAEFEHIPPPILSASEASGKFLPGADAIRIGGDRRREKALLASVGVPSAAYMEIQNKQDLLSAVAEIGLPLVLKSALDGYDGKGQWRLKTESELDEIWLELNKFLQNSRDDQAIIAEQWIPFKREVSVIGIRDNNGTCRCFSLTQNHHHNGILILSVVDSESSELQAQAESAFEKIAYHLNYVGVLAIEFFEINGALIVNELAPRVHNSGHWTQQGAFTSQFENHIRAVTGLPIANTTTIHPTAMINMIGIAEIPEVAYRFASVHPHWYDKEARPGRKMGHLNLISSNLKSELSRFADALNPADFPGLHDAITLQFK